MKNKIKEKLKEINSIFKRKEITILPANLAYFFFISMVPIVTLIIYLATTFSLSFDVVKKFLEETLSSSMYKVLMPILESGSFNGASIVILIAALFVASNGVGSIIVASNTVFNFENRNYFYRLFKSTIITFILMLVFLFLLIVPMFGESILKLFSFVGIENQITYAFNILYPVLKYPISILIVFLLVKVIYTIAPDERISTDYVNIGAAFTTIGWVIVTALYSVYINNIAIKTYNIYYGSLATIVMILLWFYLIAYIFVVGLVLNHRNMETKINKTNQIALDEIKEKVKEVENKKLSKRKKK